MCPLRRVVDAQASPRALGILVPPGSLTVVILRPRSLGLDLLLLREVGWEDSPFPFCECNQQEASQTARSLFLALQDWSLGKQEGRVESVSSEDGEVHQVQAEIGDFHFVACFRQQGKPYRPACFPTAEDARAAAEALTARLRPGKNVEQEVYINTRHLSRQLEI